MPRNGAGSFQIINTFIPATTILSSQVNANFSDVATGITTSIATDGQSTTTQPIPFSQGILTDVISEDTVGEGVTVDGALLKDGRIDWTKAGDVASSTTPDIYEIAGNYVVITGTTEIDGFATAPAGVTRWVRFSGILQLTNSSALILPGGENITTADGDIAQFISEGSGNWRCVPPYGQDVVALNDAPGRGIALTPSSGVRTISIDTTYITNFLGGLSIANNVTDANNDIDFAIGAAVDSTNAYFMKLATSLTKRLDANWVVGTNQGGLDTGSKANSTWYSCFIIARSDTGVVDALFSTSATAPTLPTNYDYFRRIGSVMTDPSGNILAFSQFGDEFLLSGAMADVNQANPGTAAVLRTLTVPLGVKVRAIFNGSWSPAGTSLGQCLISSPDQSDQAPTTLGAPLSSFSTISGTSFSGIVGRMQCRTNTSSQIRTRCGPTTASGDTLGIATIGWIDARGMN